MAHPLEYMYTHAAVIQELVERGAPVKEKNNLGWTPLDEAISYGDQATGEPTTCNHTPCELHNLP